MSRQHCRENGQRKPMPAESRTWRCWTQFSHKVIHSFGAQLEKSLPIMDLPRFLEVETWFAAQVNPGQHLRRQ
jgi:hypothetical protein